MIDSGSDRNNGYRYIRTSVPLEHVGLLREASKRRGISVSGYARRAIMAFVCHDLELDYYTVHADEAPVQVYGIRGRPARTEARGRGFGAWIVKGLRK